MDWLEKVLYKLLEWILTLIEKWFPEEPEEPEPIVAYQAVVTSNQLAVREVPKLEAPVIWLLNGGEVASLGSEMTIEEDSGFDFYQIVFGSKQGWIKEDEDKWYIQTVEIK